MMKTLSLGVAALGVGLAFSGATQAQEFVRDYDTVRAARSESDSVMLRWSAPFGGRNDVERAPRLALRLNQAAGDDLRGVDLVTYSFTSNPEARIATPFRLNVSDDGDGSFGQWVSEHRILTAIGAGLLIWGVVEATQDDDEAPAPSLS